MKLYFTIGLLVLVGVVAFSGKTVGADQNETENPNATVVYQSLDEVFNRRQPLRSKEMDGLTKDGRCQTERLIFRDTETGVDSDQPDHRYAITAVDLQGNESLPTAAKVTGRD